MIVDSWVNVRMKKESYSGHASWLRVPEISTYESLGVLRMYKEPKL